MKSTWIGKSRTGSTCTSRGITRSFLPSMSSRVDRRKEVPGLIVLPNELVFQRHIRRALLAAVNDAGDLFLRPKRAIGEFASTFARGCLQFDKLRHDLLCFAR